MINKKFFKLLTLIFFIPFFVANNLNATLYGEDAKFSPDGNYIAVATYDDSIATSYLSIYSFDKKTASTQLLVAPININVGPDGHICGAVKVSWDYSGEYIAVGLNDLWDNQHSGVVIVQFNGSSLSIVATSIFLNGWINDIKFHPSSHYIAAGKQSFTDDPMGLGCVLLFLFNPSGPSVALTSSINPFPTTGESGSTKSIDWLIDNTFDPFYPLPALYSSNSQFIVAVGHYLTSDNLIPAIRFIRFDPAADPDLLYTPICYQTQNQAIDVSINSKNTYFALAKYSSPKSTDKTINIDSYSKMTTPPILNGADVPQEPFPVVSDILTTNVGANRIKISPDGNYFIFGLTNSNVQIYSFNNNLKKIDQQISNITDDGSTIRSVDWTSDGRYWLYYTNNGHLVTNWSYYKYKNLGMARFDGTYNVYFTENHVVFQDGDNAIGEVLLKGGFTIVGDAGAKLTLNTPVYGPIDFRPTSTLDLGSDLILDSKVTFSNVGKVWGRGHTIFMTGDLTLPANSTLQFINNAALDGQGNTLFLDPHAQILIDSNVTVTFKNLIIKNKLNDTAEPPIKCIDWYGKACFDNVTFSLNNNFLFTNGQMFIHNDVEFTGTSQFSYRSAQPSYIAQHSNLIFNTNTTFEYYPSSPDNSLIKMIDHTSAIMLDGSTLQTTHTGIRLIKGNLYFDNKVTLSSSNNSYFSGLTLVATTAELEFNNNVDWSPNGKFLAVCSDDILGWKPIRVYGFNGTALTLIASTTEVDDTRSAVWSPDGKFLAVGTAGQANRLYSFDGTTLSLVFSTVETDFTVSIAWSPDGHFLVAGNAGASTRLYSFDGTTLSLIFSTAETDQTMSVAWSPDGKFLATGCNQGSSNRLYSFNGSTLTLIQSLEAFDQTKTVAWSPDGRFLATGNYVNDDKPNRLYSFNGTSLTEVSNLARECASKSLEWSPDGRFLALGETFNGFTLYRLDGTTLTPTYSIPEFIYSVSWSSDGQFIAFGTSNTEPNQVYKINYIFDNTPQSFFNSIIFGDGNPANDLDINVDPGASINLKCGKIAYLNSN